MRARLASALKWIRSIQMPELLELPEKVKAVPFTSWVISVTGWLIVWGLLELIPEAPMTKPVMAGFALCVVIAVCLATAWWFNTMVTDEHEEKLALQAAEIADLRAQIDALWQVLLDGDDDVDLDVDTDLDTTADAIPADIPAAPLPAREPAPDTAPVERVDLAGGLRLPPEGQQPPPEPDAVDDVDIALARFGLRTSEGHRP